MTTITAKVVAHSSHPGCPDLITMELQYNRFIHSEFMTHREFSRNASSSRAIPVKRQLQMILDDIATPMVWGSNKPGMQAGDELTGAKLWLAKKLWNTSCYANVGFARMMNMLGVHKQIVNRICEPYAHIKVLVTSTNWSNFLALRDHPDAQPEIRLLAKAVRKALENSVPYELPVNGWHLPYVDDMDYNSWLYVNKDKTVTETFMQVALKLSVARSARLSYNGFDGLRDIEKDLELYEKLVGGYPLHASPAEHQASPMPKADIKFSGNLRGWVQYRKTLDNEAIHDPDHWRKPEIPSVPVSPLTPLESNLITANSGYESPIK